MAKLLIKDLNSEIHISKEFIFRESDEEITLTGIGEKIGEEHLIAHIKADNLKVYNLESDISEINISPFTAGKILNISLEKVKAKEFDLRNGEDRADISGKEIDNLIIKGELEGVDLSSVKNLEIQYWNTCSKRCKQMKIWDVDEFVIRSRRYGGKRMFIKYLQLEDVKKADLTDCFLVKSKEVRIKVGKIILNEEILDEFLRLLNSENRNLYFSARKVFLILGFPNLQGILTKLVSVVKTARKKGCFFGIQRIAMANRWNWKNEGDDEIDEEDEPRVSRNSVPFEKIEKKDFTLKELLNVENIELRREIINYLGGFSKLVEKEKEKELIEKTEKGELWCIGDKNNPNNCIKFLKYKDVSTDREYLSFVPPEMKSVLEAFSWKFRVEPTEYQILTAES